MDEVIARHGVPTKLITDHGRNFEADLMKKVFEFLGVKKLRTSPYHPQTDGQVERLNRTLKGIVKTYVNQHRGKTSAHAPNYENMAGNLNINFLNKTCLLIGQKLVKQTRKYSKWVD